MAAREDEASPRCTPCYNGSFPLLNLADLLLEQARRDEADALLEAFYETKLERHSFSAALDIGNVYARHDLHETAKRYYVEGLGHDFRNPLLYTQLASVHEALREYDEALGMLEAHRDYLLRSMEEKRRKRCGRGVS